MDKIIFKNGQLLFTEDDDNLKIEVTKPVEESQFERFYDHTVEFDEELTVEGFMDALQPFFAKIDAQFRAWSNDFSIKHYYDQMKKEAEKDSNDEIEYAEFYREVEHHEYEDLKEGKTDLDFSFFGSYHGIGKDGAHWGFSLSPINNWKHYKLKLNENISCTNPKDWNNPLFKSSKKFTLHEIIRYFIYELTWHGYTDNIEEIADDMKSISDQIDAGTIETVPLDLGQMMIDSLERDHDEAIEEGKYEGAKRIRDEINRLKNENK